MSIVVSVRWEDGAAAPPGCTRRGLSATVRRAVRAALEAEQVTAAEISVALLGDEAIAALNAQWLEHDGPTDVLSFPLYEGSETPVGDVYVGVDQAARQAAQLGIEAAEEVARLAIHGTLHVLGHDHPAGESRLHTPMWRMQEQLVRRVMRT